MKYILMCVLCISLVGCASTPTATDSAKVDKAYQIVSDSVPYIKGISQATIKLALQYAEKNPERRDDLKLQIHVVAVNLEALLANGDFSPGAVTDVLKIKEEYIDSILQAVALAYTATYDKLQENDSIELAVRVLRALSQGVTAGTE